MDLEYAFLILFFMHFGTHKSTTRLGELVIQTDNKKISDIYDTAVPTLIISLPSNLCNTTEKTTPKKITEVSRMLLDDVGVSHNGTMSFVL